MSHKKHITTTIEPELHAELRTFAAKEGLKMNEVLGRALAKFIADETRKKKKGSK